MKNFVSSMIGLALGFLLLVIAPYSVTTVIVDMTAREAVLRDVSNFVDEVCDTGYITDEQMSNLQLDVASHGQLVSLKVERYQRIINPTPGSTKNATPTYTLNKDNNREYYSGDKVVVTVKSLGYTGGQRIVMSTLGAVLPDFEYSIPGRVR